MPQTKLRGALIGYGFIGAKGHMAAYLQRVSTRDDVEIVAIADICEERRWLAHEAFPNTRLYTDGMILIEQEAAELDFVDIAVPPYAHAALAEAALGRGLHVLCEKPLTRTTVEAARLVEAALRNKRVLFPCHNYKHAPVVKAIQSEITANKIGRVRSLTLSTYRNTHAKGVLEWDTNWRRKKELSGGGIAMDHGSHTFYLTFDWMQSYPTMVTAKMATFSPEYDTEDSFSAVLTFPSGLAHVHLSWTAGVRKVIYTVQADRGAITVDDDDIQIATQEKTDGPDIAQGAVRWAVERQTIASDWMDASHINWFNSLFDQFLAAIENHDFVGREAQQAVRCVELIETAYSSAREHSKELAVSNILPQIL